MKSVKCPPRGAKMKGSGKASAGGQRWRCPSCGASSTVRRDGDAAAPRELPGWLMPKGPQREMPGQGRSFRRRTAGLRGVWPMPVADGERHRVLHVDGDGVATEVMSCAEAPGEKSVERAEADRLIATSLGLSGTALTGRQRALRAAAFLLVVAAWGALTARIVFSRDIDLLLQALSGPAVTGGLLMLVALAYFSFFCLEALPGYYDENHISFVAQGPFRLNLGCLMRVHNGNWPAICRAGRWGAGVAAILMPALELALGDVLPGATIGLLGCAVFFAPILVAGKVNE